MSTARGAATDIIKLLDTVPEIDIEYEAGYPVPTEDIQGYIRFDNVQFRYPTRPSIPILTGLSFEVKPGTFVALVGASGSGKSTT